MVVRFVGILAASVVIVCGGSVSMRAQAPSPGGAAWDAQRPPIVKVAGGQLRGYASEGTLAFVGVRYATAGRFEMPRPVEPWSGVKSAQTYGAVCPVPEQTEVSADEFYWPHRYWPASEDCQFLNVWTTRLDRAARRPVMVFLHGGGFTNGSSIEGVAYDGANLSRFGNVVVVTLNHRLNVLGSFNLSAYGPQYVNAGNTGMADIEMALRWVQGNIEAFGGDPDNVTIFGQSGGSGKVVHLMHMPSAAGLFHRGIAQSSGSAGYQTLDESRRIAELTLKNLGLDAASVAAIKKVPYPQLLAAANAALAQTQKELAPAGRSLEWRPVRDGRYIEAAFSEFSRDMPFVVGTNFSERHSTFAIGDGRKNEWTPAETAANLAQRYGANADAVSREFARLFPGKKPADAFFYAPTYRTTVRSVLANRIKESRGPVYNYLFSYEAPVNGGITPFHCAELIYVFHNVDRAELRLATGAGPEARRVQDVVARAWVNFATTGNPSQPGLAWEPYTASGQGTMIFDAVSSYRRLDDEVMVKLMTRGPQ